ncbi:MAG TPA: NAD(P)H-dependent oxidoreductase subunit E [Gaiellales bacterium]|nr:NAD(P)H-dependent oxidoreductase subunit E [Gaiellales bacterium]
MSDPSTEQTLAGARETRPSMPAPAPEPPRDRPLRDRILDVAALYPESRSAIIPALRLAQEEHGWLPEEAFDEVADALELTPGYCKAVASFYDMFRLQPVGRHEVCVCTSLACTLVGAADTLRAFEHELGVEAGGSTEDGLFTLRTVECYGGCGWGPVVAIDERYHEPLPANEVVPLIERLRSEAGG